ncbi:MAG: gliding motility-associated C-terminal domain-containing protein [Bacteroidota bacterium]
MKKTTVILFLLFKVLFCSSQQFTFNGSATYNGGECYTVCPDVLNSVGSMWNNTQIDLTQPFVYDVSLSFGTKDANGADGIAFVIQQVGLNALGAQGMGIGYTGLNISLIIEFDTYQNSPFDPAADHIAIQKNGIGNHQIAANTIAAPVTLPNIENGLPHPVKITWDPAYDSLKVYFDCALKIAVQYNIVQDIFSGNPYAWWGFTSATGGSSNTHIVCFVDTLQAKAGPDVLACQAVQLNGIVTGVQPISYSWSPALGLTNPNVLNPIANPTTPTNYVLSVFDGCGFVARDTVKVTVVTMTADAGPDQTICSGDTVALHASAGSLFAWNPSATLNNSTIQSPHSLPLNTTTTYTVVITDTNGCSASDNVIIHVKPLPVIQATGSTICEGDTGTVSVTSNLTGTSYIWYPNLDTLNPLSVVPSVTTTYTVIGDALGCKDTANATVIVNLLPSITANDTVKICIGDTATLTATSTVIGTHFTWYPGLDTLNPMHYHPLLTSTYMVVGDKLGCSDTAISVVVVNPLPIITINDTAICFGNDAQLTAHGATTYIWNDGTTLNPYTVSPFQTTTYYVTGTDLNTCSDSASAIVTVHPNPIVNVNNPVICMGTDAQLIATGATTYIWNDGNNTNPYTVSPFQTTIYYVTGTDINHCVDSATAVVTVHPNPSVTALPDYVCLGDTAILTASGASTYVWSPGGSTANPLIVSPTSTTVYSVTGTNTFNCTGTDTAIVIVYPIPIIDFIANPWGTEVDEPIVFTGSSNVAVSDWLWNFGDSFTDNSGQDVTHSWASDGTFNVTLTVTSTHSCSISISHSVIIELNMQFPNVFTPNGDGVNDVFEIVGLKPDKENKLVIFNRWGKKIYEKERYDNSWTGEGSADGVYYYIFTWKNYKLNKESSYSGSVTIIR